MADHIGSRCPYLTRCFIGLIYRRQNQNFKIETAAKYIHFWLETGRTHTENNNIDCTYINSLIFPPPSQNTIGKGMIELSCRMWHSSVLSVSVCQLGPPWCRPCGVKWTWLGLYGTARQGSPCGLASQFCAGIEKGCPR